MYRSIEPLQVSCGAAHTACITRDITLKADQDQINSTHVWGLGSACSDSQNLKQQNISEPVVYETINFILFLKTIKT
jgi:hypothetical protein